MHWSRETVQVRLVGIAAGLFLLALGVMSLLALALGDVEPDTSGTRIAGGVVGGFFALLGLAFLAQSVFASDGPWRFGEAGVHRFTRAGRQEAIPWEQVESARVDVIRLGARVPSLGQSRRPGRVRVQVVLRDGRTIRARRPPERIGSVLRAPSDPAVYVPTLADLLRRHLGPRFEGCELRWTRSTLTG